MTVNVTSGGIESDARPILDLHGEEVEKRDVLLTPAKAGTRKSGSVTGPIVIFDEARKQRRPIVECISSCDEKQS